VGTFLVSESGRWSAQSAPVTATGDLLWTVSDAAIPSYQRSRTTQVGPVISAPDDPAFVAAGSALAMRGTALPGSGATVHVVSQGASASSPVSGPSVPVASDGSWTTSFTPTEATSYWLIDGRGLETPHRMVYPVGPTTASAPTSGYAGRAVVVRGDAGDAPVALRLWAKQPGGTWTLVREVTASTTGRFRARLPLANAAGQATQWKAGTRFATPVTGTVRQTLTGTAVPGDTVTIWTAAPGTAPDGAGWVQRGTATAAGDASWSSSLRFTRDASWRVTSPSGSSTVGTTIVVPTIHAPSHVVARAAVDVHGRAIPGVALTLYRRVAPATTWTVVKTVTVPTDGRWSVRKHPRRSTAFKAVAAGHFSRVVSVTVE
jgi:hypothetical protein